METAAIDKKDEGTVTLKAKGREVTVSGKELAEAAQLMFSFDTQYSDIELKEAVRGVKTIAREAIRFGASRVTVSHILQLLDDENDIVSSAANAIDEALQD